MKIVTILGARPQFIKCAPVSVALSEVADEILVHTGQHYDENMSASFFRELQIAEPRYNLGVGSGSHAVQTAAMLCGIENVLSEERPDLVLVYGDTNSTLAGAIVAAKLHVPVAHVEAGLRSFNRRMPEEINRVLTDHVSTMLLCPTPTSVANLKAEGLERGVHLVGDVMYDAAMQFRTLSQQRTRVSSRLGLKSKAFVLATIHRAENTDDTSRLLSLLAAFRDLAKHDPVVWPVHPRTRVLMTTREDIRAAAAGLLLVEPLGYLDMLWLTENARVVLTDSGGLQKEACWLGTPCVTLRDETEWIETLHLGMNRVAGTDCENILSATASALGIQPSALPSLLDGESASERIAALLTRLV